MWEFLKTIVEKLQLRTRKEKKEDRAKQLLVSLYEALWEYHAAYKAYFTDSNEFNYNRWKQATKWLVHAFERNRIGIRLFEPQLFQCIKNYLDGTTLGLIRKTSSDNSRILPGTSARKDESANCDAAFLHALERLERFMKVKMSFDDIPNAQEAYGRERLWYRSKSQLASLLRRISRKRAL